MTPGYDALRHGAGWLDLSPRGRFAVRGRDRARYLHNVTSNDVKKMLPGSHLYAFVLTPQGRIQADLDLFCFPDHFLIDTEPDLRDDKLPALLLKYKVADQVELEDITDKTASVGVEGPGAAALRPALSAPGFTVVDAAVTGQPGFRIYCPVERLADLTRLVEAAGAVAATAEDARTVRIENGKPRYGDDIRETSLPQETQQMQAVSFTKGCYVGQEIVERIRAQGHVNKLFVRLEIDASKPVAAGAKLTVDGKEAGEITSSVLSPQTGRVAALGMVRAPFSQSGTALQAGPLTARVV